MRLIGKGRLAQTIEAYTVLSQENYELLMKQRYNFAYKMSAKWQKLGISALVTPAFPHCSFLASNAFDMGLMLEYIFIWNVCNFPCGTMPIT